MGIVLLVILISAIPIIKRADTSSPCRLDGKVVKEKTIDVVKLTKDTVAVDSVPKIVGTKAGFRGESLVFSADGDGMTSWLWEFGESGTIAPSNVRSFISMINQVNTS